MTTQQLNILAIDTATEACSVALNLHGEVIQRFELAPNGHSKLVLDMVQSLLQQSGLALTQLDALAVDIGPGSFTGLRIGIGVAQGLAYGSDLAVIPVGSLEALAHALPDEIVLPAIDARMQQIYYGLYRNSPDEKLHTLIEPTLIAPADLKIGNQPKIIGTGNAWDRYAPIMQEAMNGSITNWVAEKYPEATTLSHIASTRGMQCAVSPLQLTASYVRDEVVKIPT